MDPLNETFFSQTQTFLNTFANNNYVRFEPLSLVQNVTYVINVTYTNVAGAQG